MICRPSRPASSGRALRRRGRISGTGDRAAGVGRALRSANESIVADPVVKCLLGTEAERLTGCRIAGWLPFTAVGEALEGVVVSDSSISVRRAALNALYQHREEDAVRGLFSEFAAERCEARRWAFFVPILETADPHLLCNREDPLWLGHILTEDIPYSFEHRARGDRAAQAEDVAGACRLAADTELDEVPVLEDGVLALDTQSVDGWLGEFCALQPLHHPRGMWRGLLGPPWRAGAPL